MLKLVLFSSILTKNKSIANKTVITPMTINRILSVFAKLEETYLILLAPSNTGEPYIVFILR